MFKTITTKQQNPTKPKLEIKVKHLSVQLLSCTFLHIQTLFCLEHGSTALVEDNSDEAALPKYLICLNVMIFGMYLNCFSEHYFIP